MAMHFEEMDDTTKQYMLGELDAEDAGPNPYRSPILAAAGLTAYPALLRQAIRAGSEVVLMTALTRDDYWNPTEPYRNPRSGVIAERRVNVTQAAERLALTEFNTWYVRGFAKRLLDEGETSCQAYRAAQPKWQHADCSNHEGQIFPVADVYAGHRVRYWPPPGDETRLSIPFGPGCHHTIRRVPR